jgi:hypothetical protein
VSVLWKGLAWLPRIDESIAARYFNCRDRFETCLYYFMGKINSDNEVKDSKESQRSNSLIFKAIDLRFVGNSQRIMLVELLRGMKELTKPCVVFNIIKSKLAMGRLEIFEIEGWLGEIRVGNLIE